MKCLLLLSGAAVLTAASCTTYEVRAYAGYMASELSGDIGLAPSIGNAPPSQFRADLQDDFGMGDESSSLYVRAEAALLSFRVTASGFRYAEEGTGTLTANFGDLVVGTEVASELDMLNAKVALTYDINLPILRLSPGLAVDYLEIDTSVRATMINAFEEVDVSAPIPMPYLQAEVDLGALALTLDAGWISASIEDGEGEFFDIEAMLHLQATERIEFIAGYRWISIDAEGDADGQRFDADLDLNGWFVGGGFRF
jgi:hypothetical protein